MNGFQKRVFLTLSVTLGALLIFYGVSRYKAQAALKSAYTAVLNNSPSDLALSLNPSIVNYYITLKNNTQTTLLIQAIIQKPDDPQAHEIVRMLIATPGIDLNKPKTEYQKGGLINGRSPIHWAVQRGNLEAVKLLVQAGADLTAIDPLTKMTPLAFVQSEHNPELRKEWHLDEIESALTKKRRPL